MEIEVKCFAAAREVVGAREFGMDVPAGVTVGEFREILYASHPGLRELGLQFAVNMVYVKRSASTEHGGVTFDTELQAGDVVACIPPVGGG